MSACLVVTGQKLQHGYDMKQWYSEQIKDCSTKNTNTTEQRNRTGSSMENKGRSTHFMRVIGKCKPMNKSHLNYENHHQPHILDTKRLSLFCCSVVFVFLVLQSFICSLYHCFISYPCCNFWPVTTRHTLISYIYRFLILYIYHGVLQSLWPIICLKSMLI